MSTVLALPLMYEGIQQVFISDFAPAPCPVKFNFGWREADRQDNQGAAVANRIVFVPGDDGGGAGKDAAAKWPGTEPRPLATLLELFTVYLWAFDGSLDANGVTLAENELAQYTACRLLFDAFRRAAYLTARQTFVIQSANWVVDKKARRLGAEMKLTCQIEGRVPDTSSASVLVSPIESTTTVQSADVTESLNTP
jgi:hypothetical protein